MLACEDTRRTRRIFSRSNIPSPKTVISYHEHNEKSSAARIFKFLEDEQTVALCSDAGYPGISDPGYTVVSGAVERGYQLEVIPGPSAVDTALLSSGLPTVSYTFKGFPPRKSGPRKRWIDSERDSIHTLVFFESPLRILKFLSEVQEILGDRRAAVCIELTKKFEKVRRGLLSDLIQQLADKKIRGEITVVVAGRDRKSNSG